MQNSGFRIWSWPQNILRARGVVLIILSLSIAVSACDDLPSESDEPPLSDQLQSQVQEAFGSEVTDLQIRELDVSQIGDELESGETTIPVANPDNEITEITFASRPANLRPDTVATGYQRQGPESSEQVPLPPEQSYVVGDLENANRIGGLTILDDQQTMLRGLVRHTDLGLSYIQSVNQVLETDEYPNWHVIYNAANTGDLEIGDDGLYASTQTASAQQEGESDPDVSQATSNISPSTTVVLDGDVEFYNKDPSTVWRRQESLLLAVNVTAGLIEPISSNTWQLGLGIAGQEVWTSDGPSTTSNDSLMRRLEDSSYYLINSLSEDQMHLFLVGYDVNGLAGRAGGIGDPNGGWGGGSGDNHLLSEALYSLRMNRIILTHEVGHLIGGHHGNSITSGCSGSACGRSVMTPTVRPDNEYFFSDANDQEISDVIDAVLP